MINTYRICSICFADMVRSGEFEDVSPFAVKDTLVDIVYFADESVPCDSLKSDNDIESICSGEQNA